MTDQQPIYVNDELFLGRVEEQEQFRLILPGVINPPPGEELPYIILLYGQGGIGKTTLAHRYRIMAETEPQFEGLCQILKLGPPFQKIPGDDSNEPAGGASRRQGLNRRRQCFEANLSHQNYIEDAHTHFAF